jgi:hypothetical protein
MVRVQGLAAPVQAVGAAELAVVLCGRPLHGAPAAHLGRPRRRLTPYSAQHAIAAAALVAHQLKQPAAWQHSRQERPERPTTDG